MPLKLRKLLALYGKFPVYLAPKPALKTMYVDIIDLYCLHCFLLFRLCIFILICLY